MSLNAEIDMWWCLGATWECTPVEAAGIWSVIFFYSIVVLVTVIHLCIQYNDGTDNYNERETNRYLEEENEEGGGKELIFFVVYFFVFVVGCIVWVVGGTRYAHPFQNTPLQLFGISLLFLSSLLFILVHFTMGANWSPQPEQKTQHQLVVSGVFGVARHPMYAIFLWGCVGTFCATLNWVVGWCVFGLVLMVLTRIEVEERILIDLYGEEYLEYRRRVLALGVPWCFLGFDEEITMYSLLGREEVEEKEV